jgi:hypothetical protein
MYTTILLLLNLIFLIPGVFGSVTQTKLDTINNILINRNLLAENHIVNSSFEEWSEPVRDKYIEHVYTFNEQGQPIGLPTSWKIDEIYNYWPMFFRSTKVFDGKYALSGTRNCKGRHFLYQELAVERNTLYTAEILFRITERLNFRPGGLIIVGKNTGQIL